MKHPIMKRVTRQLRTHVTKFVRFGDKALYLLSPKQTGKDWRYAAIHDGELVLFGKSPETRDNGRKVAKERWGAVAKDYGRVRKPKAKKAAA